MKTSQFFDNSKQFLSAKQIALYLNVSVKTVYKWVDRGLLEAEHIGPKLIRFDKEKVDQWVNSNRKEPKDHGNY